MTCKKGRVVAIIGPSGSGKSTFFAFKFIKYQMKARLKLAMQSSMRLNIHEKAHHLRQQTAMVFQNYNLFKNKTALQNITESLLVTKKMTKRQANEIGMFALNQVGLEQKANSYPVTLSGGQQRRIGIARALAD
ncbi:ATP-binding cassette domain-containing protein [Bacillus sp. SL00103]